MLMLMLTCVFVFAGHLSAWDVLSEGYIITLFVFIVLTVFDRVCCFISF